MKNEETNGRKKKKILNNVKGEHMKIMEWRSEDDMKPVRKKMKIAREESGHENGESNEDFSRLKYQWIIIMKVSQKWQQMSNVKTSMSRDSENRRWNNVTEYMRILSMKKEKKLKIWREEAMIIVREKIWMEKMKTEKRRMRNY